MATTDDNDNQGSSTGGAEEISVDDIANENSPCNDENRADNTVDMTTKDQNSSIPLNLTSSRLDSNLVPFPDDNVENDAINSSQSSPTCENRNGVNNEEDGDEDASVCEQDRLTPGHDQSLPLESNESPECEGNKLEKSDEKVEGKEEDSNSATSVEISHQNENIAVSGDDFGDGQRSECNKNDRNTDSGENGGAFEEERGKDGNLEDLSPVVSNCEESMDTLTTEQNVGDGEDEASKPEKELVDVSRSATSTPQFTSILNSEESDRQDTPVQSNTSFVCGEEQAPGSIISDQNSQSSLADEPPILISSEAECFIHLDEETFNEWSEKRRKMGFDSDAAMAKFMLRRLAVDGCSEGPSDSQDTERSKVQIMESQSKQKKSITFGGIESIVRRLHQVRSDTPETSQPGSDNEDIVKIKTEPVDMCNSDDVESAAIPKKATTAIYSSGRNGRKRVYVKREPGTDEWMQNHDSPQTSGYDDQQVSDYADHYPPIRIKQEKIDPSDTDMAASTQSKGIDENPTTIGQFVRSAASWVSNLVASELEKPQETAVADAPDTAETLFSDSRLHKIIEEQLSKPSEPSVSEIRLQSVIEEQLNKPIPKIGCALIESVDSAQSKAAKKEMKKARREARQAKKLKKAQKREREKELQEYGEMQQSYSPFERPLNSVSPFDKSYSPFEKSISPFQTSSSPFDQSRSPFDKSRSPFEKAGSPYENPPSQEPVSASHALESFARMVQIREFQGGSQIMQQSPQVSTTTGIQRSPPIPTALHTSEGHIISSNIHTPPNQGPIIIKSESNSPAPDTSDAAPNNGSSKSTGEHPASFALKSFAQKSIFLPAQTDASGSALPSPAPVDGDQPHNVDTGAASPLEQLLKVAETPHQSAKSQLEHLLKAKDIKEQWSKPSSVAGQQLPYHVTQAQTSYSPPHILKVPKVTLSGRISKDTPGQDSLFRGPAFDYILAATGVSSDSDDGEVRDAKERNRDPDWSSPRRRQRSRKRSLLKNAEVTESVGGVHVPTQINASSLVLSQDTKNDIGAENRVPVATGEGSEPAVKHQRLNEDGAVQGVTPSSGWTNGSANKSTELSATNTLAKLLQMATKNNQVSNLPNSPPSGTAVSQCPGTPPNATFTPKQSAFGAMQAFAQLVEIQGKSPEIQLKLKKPREKLSDSLPPITSNEMHTPTVSKPAVVKLTYNQNGGKYQDDFRFATKVNGSGADMQHDLDAPEDLTMHSRVQIKMEPIDVDDDVVEMEAAGPTEEPMQYTCSLCSRIFSSVSEVTDHKLRIHYSSNFEIIG